MSIEAKKNVFDFFGHMWPIWSHIGKQRWPTAFIGGMDLSTSGMEAQNWFHGMGHPIL